MLWVEVLLTPFEPCLVALYLQALGHARAALARQHAAPKLVPLSSWCPKLVPLSSWCPFLALRG